MAYWDKAKDLFNVFAGKRVPAWAPPAFAAAAVAPVVGYQLDESTREEERQKARFREFLQYGYNPPSVMRRDLRRSEASISMPLSAETDDTASPRGGGQSTGPGGTIKSACTSADLDKIKGALQTLKARQDSMPRGAPLRAGAHKLAKD